LKSVVAQFNASQLITQREAVSRLVRENLVKRAARFNILLDDVSLTHLAFSPEFTAAVEAKQVAQQEAQRAAFVVDRARQEKQAIEAKRLHEERMQPIGENEQVEWDGLRRRKTVLEPGQSPLQRRKTVHPPLGMSQFPHETESVMSDDDDIHPGFFTRLRSRGRSGTHQSVPPVPLEGLHFPKDSDGPPSSAGNLHPHSHVYGLPPGLQRDMQQDTSYKPHEPAIQWAAEVEDDKSKPKDSLAPPKPPPHTAKRQFSFQNVFHRNRAESAGEGSGSGRPMSRGALSFSSKRSSKDHTPQTDGTTEEERLGLVKGDSQILLNVPNYGGSPPDYSDTEDGFSSIGNKLTPVPSESSLPQFAFEPRTRNQKKDDDTDDDDRYDETPGKDIEKSGSRSPGAFM